MSKLSTEHLNLLPNPKELQQICRSISAIEAIICPEWQYRYFSYQKDWSETEEVCEMRNGQGDQMLILFSPQGVCINGFAKHSEMNGWKNIRVEEKKSLTSKLFKSKKETKTILTQEIAKGVLDILPEVFNGFIYDEPIKSIGTTFCIWRILKNTNWKIGEVELPTDDFKDGSAYLLQLLDGKPSTYRNWAQEYYEEEFETRELSLEHIEIIYAGQVITRELVEQINPDLNDFDKLETDLNEIGFKHQL
ncbi:MAG: hypothetical protein P8P74_09655 [Crocinitomicaceae bacterium]|nr:hypothetical protein [Crocinitomicaceae bacterium]